MFAIISTKEVGRLVTKTGLGAMGLFKAVAAGVTSAALAIANVKNALHTRKPKKQTAEVITMKKSTVIALFAALAAVAGVLGALYVYVLRREKELDEYEQLLFSEDFGDDDMSDDDLDELLAKADEE